MSDLGQKWRPVLLKSFKNLQVVIWAPQLGTLVLSVQRGGGEAATNLEGNIEPDAESVNITGLNGACNLLQK